MSLPTPNKEDILSLAAELGLDVPDTDAAAYAEAIAGVLPAYAAMSAFAAEQRPPGPGAGRSHSVPDPADNPLNAWAVRCAIRERQDGRLAGRKVAVKDSVMVAGIPMSNGSNILDGYVPQADATIVQRMLAEGAEIAGKTTCEYLCLSGGSHTSWTGPVINPRKPGYTTGGSSSGSAAVVAAGEVDLAIGADQAGSIRMPASWSGIVGLKPTWGLVPYTGCAPIESTFDHVGPMTATVADNALLLDVIAGPDGVDPRQAGATKGDYLGALARGAKGLRIGVVTEGFGIDGAEPDVDAGVRRALDTLRRLGAEVREISLPLHSLGAAIWLPIGTEGLSHTLMEGTGFGVSRLDDYPTDLMHWFHERRGGMAQAPANVKTFLMLARHVTRQAGYAYYGAAINAARALRAAYDAALAEVDLLAMPTTPMKATPLPAADAGPAEVIRRATEMFANTCPFDVTHHPAISLPCGTSDGLPVGLMLVGRHFDEAAIYRAAAAYEGTGEGLAPIPA
ncbi:MAG: amidase [Sneathiellaceae bacterium]